MKRYFMEKIKFMKKIQTNIWKFSHQYEKLIFDFEQCINYFYNIFLLYLYIFLHYALYKFQCLIFITNIIFPPIIFVCSYDFTFEICIIIMIIYIIIRNL